MPSVFQLWGELRADTRNFDSALIRANKELSATQRQVDKLENSTKSFGMTSNVTGRSIERKNEAVSKLGRTIAAASTAYDRGEISQKKYAAVLGRTANQIDSLNGKIKDATARANDFNEANVGSGFRDIAMYAGIATAAVGSFALKAAMNLENARNKFTALEGSVEAANKRIRSLQELSRKSVGVNMTAALDAFAQLKVLGTVSDTSIEKMIQGLGRLRLAFDGSMGSTQDFLLNLQQLFDQGFEAQDWKQAIGRVQIFEQLIEKAFGTKDTAKLQAMKDSGKITMESWIEGFAGAALNDSRLKGLTETFSVQISKALSEVNIAIAPLGQKLIDSFSPALKMLTDEMQKDSPNYQAAGEKIAEYVGNSIGKNLKSSIDNIDFHKIIADRIESDMKGKTLPISFAFSTSMIAGAMKGLGMDLTPDFEGIKLALKNLVNYNTQHIQMLWRVWAQIPGKVAEFLNRAGSTLLTLGGGLATIAFNIGKNIGEGFVNGMRSMYNAVAGAAAWLAGAAEPAARDAVKTESPSKVFFAIGKDVGQGFINGIVSMEKSVAASIAKLVTPQAAAKAIKESVKEMVKSLGEALNSVASTSQGYGQTIAIRVAMFGAEEAKKQLDELIDLRIRLGTNLNLPLVAGPAAKDEIARLTSIEERLQGVVDVFKEVTKVEVSPLQHVFDLFKEEEAAAAIERVAKGLKLTTDQLYALSVAAAKVKMIGEMTLPDSSDYGSGRAELAYNDKWAGLGPSPEELNKHQAEMEESIAQMDRLAGIVPPLQPWENFWVNMKARMGEFKATLPTIKASLGENLINAIYGIGDVFANAVANWDGTAKGFFKSLAQGFRQLVSELIAQLVRLMVIQAIMKIIGGAAGGAGGGKGGGLGDWGGGISPTSAATGGFISGPGTGTSDSIPAMLSNGEYVINAKSVKKWGAGFFEGLNNFTGPALAMAGGGMVGGGATYNSSTSTSNNPTIIVNMPSGGGGGGQNLSRDQVERAVMVALQKSQMRHK